MDILSKFLNPGIGILLTMVSGFWLSKVGKPYNGILFNVHKLVALGTVVITAIQVYKMLVNSDPRKLILISIFIIWIFVMALFTSGAFLSIGTVNYQAMKTIHHVALVLVTVAATLMICLLLSGKP